MKRNLVIIMAAVISMALTLVKAEPVYGSSWNVSESSHGFVVDGKSAKANPLIINGSNYIKISEFAELLDIGITYNEVTKTVILDKTKPYSGVHTFGGVYLPRTELPEKEPASVGRPTYKSPVVTYNNRVYTEVSGDHNFNYSVSSSLIGERLGKADAWIYDISKRAVSDKEVVWEGQWAEHEIDVYAAKGYDASFRICIILPSNGGDYEPIWLLENLNGTTIGTGRDVFEERLHLKDYYTGSIGYQNSRGNGSFWGFTKDDCDSFIDELYDSHFVQLSPTPDPVAEYAFIMTENRLILMLAMEDGTSVWLYLFEGGYVLYHSLQGDNYGMVLSKMNPDGIFNKFFTAVPK